MAALFRVETQRVSLTWSLPRGGAPAVVPGPTSPPGGVRVEALREGAKVQLEVWPEQERGPYVFEQTDYKLYARAKDAATPLELRHRDPVVTQELEREEGGAVLHGVLSFGAQVGMARLVLVVGGVPELALTLEVFPSKLDYRRDYDWLMEDVQRLLTGLALEYLRGAMQRGEVAPVPRQTPLEWVALLRGVFTTLERAMIQVQAQPLRAAQREVSQVRASRARRVDAPLRRALRAGEPLASRLTVPQVMASATLDTPEHRWMARELERVAQRLSALRAREARQPLTARRAAALAELDAMRASVARWLASAPLSQARGGAAPAPPARRARRAAGDPEALRASMTVQMGVFVRGGPLELSVKDLSLLYEYWCYLALLRLLAELLGATVRAESLLQIDARGLVVRLRQGHANATTVALPGGDTLTLVYQPHLEGLTGAQRPDLLLTLHREGWPAMRLVLDAKYRLEGDGPPTDAVNALHRYRDALVASDPETGALKHDVVQGAALFPWRDPAHAPGAFASHRLWRALDQLGVGAIPLLPGSEDYARQWLTRALGRGGWGLAQAALGHVASEQLERAHRHAEEIALIGVLRAGDEQAHLDWIEDTSLYYVPLTGARDRQLEARWVALYLPAALRRPGAVLQVAQVLSVEVKARHTIATPWPTRRDPDALRALYTLSPWQALPQPIENTRGERVSTPRWTTRLALNRARSLEELLWRDVATWRLVDALRERGTRASPERANSGSSWVVTRSGAARPSARDGAYLLRDGIAPLTLAETILALSAAV